jgi:hypothetical protein
MRILIAFTFMVLASTAPAQPEQWLNYHTSSEGRSYHWLELTTNPPPNVALPKLNAAPCFARWLTPMDPSGGRWICLDRTGKSGPYNRLFIDSNGNGRLDDESPLNANRTEPYQAYFDPARFVFKGEDGPITYHLLLRFYQYDNSPASLLVSSGGWYEGDVDFGDKKRRVQLIDGNVNGTFDDQSANAYECDRVAVGGAQAGGQAERFLGRMLEVDGELFRIEVARDGAFIKIQKLENVPLGQVRVPEAISEFTAFGENGHFIRKPVHGELSLPTGNYRVQGWTINRKDDKGAAWTLSGYNFNEAANFEVSAGRPATLQIHEPVRAVMQATEATSNEITFSLRLQGQLGESIEMLRAGQRPAGPRLTLANADGSFRYTNSFEFG